MPGAAEVLGQGVVVTALWGVEKTEVLDPGGP